MRMEWESRGPGVGWTGLASSLSSMPSALCPGGDLRAAALPAPCAKLLSPRHGEQQPTEPLSSRCPCASAQRGTWAALGSEVPGSDSLLFRSLYGLILVLASETTTGQQDGTQIPVLFCFSRHLVATEFLATNIYWDIKRLFGGVVKVAGSMVLSDGSRNIAGNSLIFRELRMLFTCGVGELRSWPPH